MTVIAERTLRVGVDVGGTNTDAVILELTPGNSQPVLATHKAPTTPDITSGIQAAISSTINKAQVDANRIQAVAIGTTSFVNSLIERDSSKLERVAVIRLCGPFSKGVPPFVSFPYELRHVLEGPTFFVDGGLQVDGSEILPVNPLQIRAACAEIKRSGIRAVAISGCYSPIDHEIKQEELVRAIVRDELPGSFISISKEVANIGLLQRENATILNAALLPFAQKTVDGFRKSTKTLQLDCPIFLTSNDGTLMRCDMAAKFPIKTFTSGPTNSMRGANFLAGLASGAPRKETALVIDVGGTTTEIGVLLPTGFPRQAAAYHELCGVPLNFSMPHVHSIGLGGGSKVRFDAAGRTSVGPDSVGYNLTEQALSFGGDVLTTTDIMVAAGRANIGDPTLVRSIQPGELGAVQQKTRQMLELAIDSMKTSTEDVPVYLVGGGAILVSDELRGVSQVHRFPYYDAANAVGAACAQISGVIDTFADTSVSSVAEVQKQIGQKAIDKAVSYGADPAHTVVVESEAIPIAYSTGNCRFFVKAAGPWSGVPAAEVEVENDEPEKIFTWDRTTPATAIPAANEGQVIPTADRAITAEDILDYRPDVRNHEWTLSELDIEWIATGCYILGTGGGGNPHTAFLGLREMLRRGATSRVIDVTSLNPSKVMMYGGGIGSPEVAAEKIGNNNAIEAITALLDFLRMDNLGALAALEIGGGNGIVNMICGASTQLNVPVLDGDFMGRAYPTGWQTTVNVNAKDDRGSMQLPCSMASGDGNTMFLTTAKHYKDIDNILRAGCMEMGTSAMVAARPLTKAECEQALIKNTVSQSWQLGRAVALANKQSNIANIGSILVDALGGVTAAKVLFEGKIVNVGRRIQKGWSYGEIEIHALASEEEVAGKEKFKGVMKIPFKNENLLCEHTLDGKTEIVAGVPDLIAVLDAQNGTALGVPEYKYGLRVLVLGITAAPQWTDTPRGLELGSLKAFGYDEPYRPLGTYAKPRSVIEQYNMNV